MVIQRIIDLPIGEMKPLMNRRGKEKHCETS
jgi:hypothetical protein